MLCSVRVFTRNARVSWGVGRVRAEGAGSCPRGAARRLDLEGGAGVRVSQAEWRRGEGQLSPFDVGPVWQVRPLLGVPQADVGRNLAPGAPNRGERLNSRGRVEVSGGL